MWNSGSEVISRSAAVSSIQYGKPSPAIAYARWVCMTSLDRPGGARGRDQHGQVAGADAGAARAGRRGRAGPRAGRRPAVGQRADVQDAGPGQAGDARLGDQRVQAGVGDHARGAGLVRQPGQLGRGTARVGGDGDRAERGQGQPAQQVRRGGPGGHHDQVAVADPGLAQRLRRWPPLGQRAAEGQRTRRRCGARSRRGHGRPPRSRTWGSSGRARSRAMAMTIRPGAAGMRSLGHPARARGGRPRRSTSSTSSRTSSGTRPPAVQSAQRMPMKLPIPV